MKAFESSMNKPSFMKMRIVSKFRGREKDCEIKAFAQFLTNISVMYMNMQCDCGSFES